MQEREAAAAKAKMDGELRQRKAVDGADPDVSQRSEPTDAPRSRPAEAVKPQLCVRSRVRKVFDAWFHNRRTVGWLSLCCGLVAAVLAWPTLMEYEESWHKPAARFATSLGIGSGVAVSAGLSPSLSPFQGSTFNWFKLGGVWLILGNVYVAFGMLGPDGALCIASLLLATVSLRPEKRAPTKN